METRREGDGSVRRTWEVDREMKRGRGGGEEGERGEGEEGESWGGGGRERGNV